jgi:uncharacterized protein (DUF2147 family)
MRHFTKTFALAAIIAVGAAAGAQAGDATGTWLRADGTSKVRFSPCGGALCGTIAWLKNPAESKGKVGQRVFFDMKPNGDNAWSGSAFNPEDGKTYTGKMTLSGNSLTTKGCVLGGIICKSVSWSRAN